MTPIPIDMEPATDQFFLILYGTGMRGAGVATATVGGEPVGVAGPVAQGQFVAFDQMNLGPLQRTLIGRGQVDIEAQVDGKAVNIVTVVFK